MPPNSSKRSAKSTSKRESQEVPEILNWIDKLNQAIDDLSESRTSTREESLEIVVDTFACHHVFSQIENRIEEILGLLKRSLLKHGSTKEACLAARAIALAFVNLSEVSETEADDLYRRILPSLRNTIKDSEDIAIKINCLQTLSLITYTAASDIDKQLVRDYLFDLIETDGADFNVEHFSTQELDDLFCAAIQAYGVLYASSFTSGFVDFDVLWEELEKVMPVHEIMLESSDKDVRIAAGENIGLMFETANIFLLADNQEEEEEEGETVKPEYDNMDGLIHTLKELSVDSSRRRAKSDRAEQKSIFRDIVKSVEENIKPVEELKINGRVLSFRGWAKILPLNAFRRSLHQGLQHHLKTNLMMKEIFHYTTGYASRQQFTDDSDDEDGYDVSALSNVDRKYLFEENKKNRSKQIRNARLGKENPPVY
ncbi:interferon-related developmental regulator-domain-containing protein [Gilbertella persicaria]|uniref:interferon-related developmental regulator-domain-containing protein n=1 Tax=Gilbertella persicaria TaxID=101096 RepID=UPI00221F324A|nr:interferon-related developmental regulator-domain-containing protein [Gilbertella persicaria]KAI8084294.1 interferon-related developmental regulator-domain-containing protein [Gilbertella persicaria]